MKDTHLKHGTTTNPVRLNSKAPAVTEKKTPGKTTGFWDDKKARPVEADIKEFSLSTHLRAQYAKRNKLPPNPIDGREHDIVAVQLSLIETQKTPKLQRDPEEKKSKKAAGKEETKSPLQKPRQLEDLLRQEESALDYYEAWHNVTQTITVAEMLESHGATKPIQRVLVMGPAGIGKTTMLHYIAHQWSLGKLWQERFQAVFWLPLRCLLKEEYQKHSSGLSVAQLLHRECLAPEAQESFSVPELQNFLTKNKSQIALLLDGFDECAMEVEEAKSSVFRVFNDLLDTGTVLMTSRPYRLNQTLVKKFDRHLENRGFSDAQVQKYVTDYFDEKPSLAQRLIQLLQHQPRLKGMSYIPLILSLLCSLQGEELATSELAATEAKEKSSEPSLSLAQTENLSGLYQQLTGYLVKRYLKERTQKDTRGVEDLELLMDYCHDELNFLGHLAFQGLVQREILLSPTLFKGLAKAYRVQPHLPDKTLRLGFLQKAGEGHQRGDSFTPHYFIHLSFQEFFAARYLVESLKHPKSHPRYQDAMQFLRTQKYEARYAMVFRFASGLCSQDKTQDKAVLSFWKALLSPPFDVTGIGHLSLMIRCLDEAAGDERVPHRKMLQEEIEHVFRCEKKEKATARKTHEINRFIRKSLHHRLLTDLEQTTSSRVLTGVLRIYLTALQDKDVHVRKKAFEPFMQLAKKTAIQSVVPELVRSALKSDPKVAWTTSIVFHYSEVMDVIKVDSVLPELLAALKDDDRYVRCCAVSILGCLEDQSSIETVIPLLFAVLKNDGDGFVRDHAAEALGRLGDKAATQSVIQVLVVALKDKDAGSEAANALVRLGKKLATELVVQTLLLMLNDKDLEVRVVAAGILGQLGEKAATEPVIRALTVALKDKEWRLRSSAAEALGQLGEKAAVEPVLQAMVVKLSEKESEKESDVRSEAAYALGLLGEKAAIEPVIQALLEVLKDKESSVRSRCCAAHALGKLGVKALNKMMIQVLVAALKDKDRAVRSEVAQALGQLGGKAAIEPVIRALLVALKDEHEDVRDNAAKALAQLGEKAATEQVFQGLETAILKDEVNMLYDYRYSAIEALGHLGKRTTTIESVLLMLITALKDEEESMSQEFAARAIGQLGEKAATEPVIQALLAALKDKYSGVRCQVAIVLGQLGEKAAIEPVIQELVAVLKNKDECWSVRESVVTALARLGKESVIDPVIQALLNEAFSDKEFESDKEEGAYCGGYLGDLESSPGVTNMFRTLKKLPIIVILQNYFQIHVPLLRSVNKDYAQMVAKLLLWQNIYLIYDSKQKQLILGQGQVFALATANHRKLAKMLMRCLHEQAETFGLPLSLADTTRKDPYPVPDAADLPTQHFAPPPLERRLSVLEAPLLQRLLKKEKVKLLADQQQDEIKANPLLCEYYYSFIQYFDEAWKASGVIHSKLVAHGKKTKADYVAAGVNLVGGAVSIPGVSLITGVLERAVNAYTYRDKHHTINCVAQFFSGSEESSAYIELLSRILTLVFAEKIAETADPEQATTRQKAERVVRKVKNAVIVGDVNTPIQQLAEAHVEVILKAIIGGKIKPHPKADDLPRFIEVVQAHSHADHLNLSPVLTTTEAGRHLLEQPAKSPMRSRSGALSLAPSDPPASLLAAALTDAFGTSGERKVHVPLSSASQFTLAPDG